MRYRRLNEYEKYTYHLIVQDAKPCSLEDSFFWGSFLPNTPQSLVCCLLYLMEESKKQHSTNDMFTKCKHNNDIYQVNTNTQIRLVRNPD